jgi:hypothetical protein
MDKPNDISQEELDGYTGMINLFLLLECPGCMLCFKTDPSQCAITELVKEMDGRLEYMPSESKVRLAVPDLKPEVVSQIESLLPDSAGGE